jgi:hypothetical protein
MKARAILNQSELQRFLYKRLENARYWSKKDNRECNLTREDLFRQWDKQKGLCVYSNLPMSYVGKVNGQTNKHNVSIDRVDNTRGYTVDNIVLCCGAVNTMKNDLTQKEFQTFVISMARTDYFSANAHLVLCESKSDLDRSLRL